MDEINKTENLIILGSNAPASILQSTTPRGNVKTSHSLCPESAQGSLKKPSKRIKLEETRKSV